MPTRLYCGNRVLFTPGNKLHALLITDAVSVCVSVCLCACSQPAAMSAQSHRQWSITQINVERK